MKKFLTKSLLFLTIFTALWSGKLFAQTITVGSVDPGPYAPGSSVSVPISVTGDCVTTKTTYSLYLSDASGSFANKILIGFFSNFYATFINGVIPLGTPAGSGYIVKVVSVNPTLTSSNSAAFTINAGTGITAAVSSQLINPAYPEVFGTCIGVNNASYSFVNQSTPGSTVTASFYNEQTHAIEGSLTPTTAGTPFIAKASQYTITVKAVNGGIVGTKSYFLINNSVNTSFGVTGSNTICLSAGGILSYNVDISSASGIQNNFPGLIYTVKWGDGAITLLTLCDIIAAGGKISHNYTTSSCGRNPNGQHNAFEVDLQPADLYCGNVGTQVTSYAQVITAPLNMFRSAIAACVNTPVTFENLSDPGQDPKSTTSDCKSSTTLYTWIVDGKIAATNYSLTQNFLTTFTTTGTHSITLHLQNGNALCTATDTTQTICIQNAPQPKFTLPVTTGCAPLYIIPINQSIIDVNCSSTNKYVWTVTGPGNVTYSNGTNNNSAQPQFVFHNPGAYTLQLGITTVSCGTILAPVQILNIDSIAVAKLSPDTILCGSNQILNFNASRGETQTLLTGSSQNLPGTYSWKVTGGKYSFTGGTSDTSKYPQISFTDFATYSVSVSNSNTCGPVATATQHITFRQAPVVSAGSVASFCANQSYTLNGSITGVYNNTLWEGGTGTFNPGRNTLNPVYTPSVTEINAGKVALKLAVFTSLSAPCDSIKSSVTLYITKPDSITSASRDSVCSGTPVKYQITAVAPNSSFTWTVDPNKTSASVSGYSANGKGTVINDVLLNSDPANYAIITYDITAVGGSGCSSNTFVLTVAVAPKLAVAKFTQNVKSGCDTVKVKFTNASTPSNSTFAWNFGDGSAILNAVSPSHTFLPRTDGKDTTYTVTLTLLARCGNPVPFTSSVTVRPKTPIAFISPKQITGCSPFILAVDNFSPGTNQSYTYYLYDGTTLVQQITTTDKSQVRFTPINVASTKQFSLFMVATGYCGTTAQSTTIPITISASNIISQMFIENGSNKGCAPFMVNFINNSLGADTYYYTIYDVNNKVVDRRQGGTAVQSYTFNTAGTFYVTITAANSCSTVESAPPLRVDVYPVPTPLFTANDTTGCKTIITTFINQTQGDSDTQATSFVYDWDFGDGSPHSPLFSPPPHTYSYKNSPFTVTLTATNIVSNCSKAVIKVGYINVTAPPFAQFSEQPDSVNSVPDYNFSFQDQTAGSAATWNWTFGDGTASTSQNPEHTYRDTGFYKVSLTATSISGCDSTVVHVVRITGIPGSLYLPNAFEPLSGINELQTFKAKGSGIREWHLQIFNNFSQLVWETTKLDEKGAPVEGWDGTFKGAAAQQGVYVWQASATFLNGTEWLGNTYNNALPKRTGVVHLIR